MDYIWINGMPRSGTSWLSQIFDSHPNVRFKLSPLFSYAFKNAVNVNSNRDEWLQFFREVYFTNDEFMDQNYRRKSGEYPNIKSKESRPSHLVIKDTRYHNLTEQLLNLVPEMKFVHIVRNPCGAINSWINTPKEFPKGADPYKEWRSGECRKTGEEEFWGFEDWKYLTNFYLLLQSNHPRKVMIVKYDYLVDRPFQIIEKMFEFVGIDLSCQTIDFVRDSQNRNVENEYAVYKKKAVKDKWRYQLDRKIVEEIYRDLENTPLSEFL
ncbi:MAG: sulfotransferase [Bacteroidales bacterium]|nr:sulfotransferase [Bacteroidales bacterium]